MGYASLQDCVRDLESAGDLLRVDAPIDPHLELAAIQRRAFRAEAPALLFTRVKGVSFPVLVNLFGTRKRLHFLFRQGLCATEAVLAGKADPLSLLHNPRRSLCALGGLWHMLPKKVQPKNAPVLHKRTSLKAIPKIVSWPLDGGPFITLPLVYSEDPAAPGVNASNLGMYRIQISGNDYADDEVGLHYQIHRGIGIHHAHALAKGEALAVRIHAGGPPALSVAAVMPLPEGLSELRFAGLLGARRVRLTKAEDGVPLPLLAETDFCISGYLLPHTRPEGPFGDHVGYYSLRHDFPAMRVVSVFHRKDAIWPYTSVGRPPQEDTIFGDFIHELTKELVPQVFAGVCEVHAVDAAGVHPLLLALGSERYTPWEARRRPRELLVQAMHLLGTTQTALAKYLLITAQEDAPGLSCRQVEDFLAHMLERTDFSRDLHFLTQTNTDTLDYTGTGLNEGSKLIWAACGQPRRRLGKGAEGLASLPELPSGFGRPQIAGPGILVLEGPRHAQQRGLPDPQMEELARRLGFWEQRESFPLAIVADDAAFCAASTANLLWVAFTRSDPATDIYGAHASIRARHWACEAPLVIDARLKPFHAPPLEEDPDVSARVDALAARGKPLHGLW